MGNLSETIADELSCKNVFTIPLFGGIGVSEATVVTWIIMLVIFLICFIMTRNLKVENPGKRQLLVESAVDGLTNMAKGFVGEEGGMYVDYLITVLLYLAFANLIGMFGFKPPTKDLRVTAALAIMSIILIEFSGLKKHGPLGFLKSFGKPSVIVAPLNVLEIGIRPLSLCMRLFGNVLGSLVIMKLIEAVVPVFIPVVFSLYFDIFDGLIQAYVFVFLTGIFIKEQIEM